MSRMRSLLLLVALAGCTSDQPDTPPTGELRLATTTSTRDSGLLEHLLPEFESRTGIRVKVIAVGTGQALELGRRGDADVLLTHAPRAELQFLSEGHAESRYAVMHNDFILVGPPSDPASVEKATSAAEAFRAIAHSRSRFLSRGDDSGTHKKELSVWHAAGIEPRPPWYAEAGTGMGTLLQMAHEKQAYTLTDRGTWLAMRDSLDLPLLLDGDGLLLNSYAVMVVSPRRHPQVAVESARAFAGFLTAGETQQRIARFGVDRFGQSLFVPDAAAPRTP